MVLNIASDGGRFGVPCEETNIYAVEVNRNASWGMPQVTSAHAPYTHDDPFASFAQLVFLIFGSVASHESCGPRGGVQRDGPLCMPC